MTNWGKLLLLICLALPFFRAPPSNAQATSQILKPALEKAFKSQTGSPNSRDITQQVARTYQKNNFNPLWSDGAKWLPVAQKAIHFLSHADEEGLNPALYLQDLPSLESPPTFKGEIALTRAFLHYISDIKGELINPRKLDKYMAVTQKKVDEAEILLNGLKEGSANWMAELSPPHEEYQKLKVLLAEYRKKAEEKTWPTLVITKKLEFGQKHPKVRILRTLLQNHGIMPEAVPKTTGTNKPEIDSDVFDKNVEAAVRAFQTEQNLDVDGIVGPKTTRALNMNPIARIQQIITTMERWRWFPDDPGERYIHVNIPQFILKAYHNRKVALESPIIVGRHYRKTPVLSTTMTRVTFNPSWTIPSGILVKDKLPKLRKDPSYADQKGYVVYEKTADGYKQVAATSINWEALSNQEILARYKICQPPGPQNALGKVRFYINNEFTVFLHSTPQQYLFEKPVRAFSSGCIRVLKHVDLAAYVLNSVERWPKSLLVKKMKGVQTENVPLKKPLPVYITYFTLWFDHKGQVHFSDDVYDQDERVWRILSQERFKDGTIL